MSDHLEPDEEGRQPESRMVRRRPLEVIVNDGGVESALKHFKRLVLRDGILRELKQRRHYEKPGERKRRKIREAARRRRRQLSRALRRKDDRW